MYSRSAKGIGIRDSMAIKCRRTTEVALQRWKVYEIRCTQLKTRRIHAITGTQL